MSEPAAPFFVISDQHLQGAYDVLKGSMVIARAFPNPLTQQHAHTALAQYELLTLQAFAERFVEYGLGEPQRDPRQWNWLQDAAENARAVVPRDDD